MTVMPPPANHPHPVVSLTAVPNGLHVASFHILQHIRLLEGYDLNGTDNRGARQRILMHHPSLHLPSLHALPFLYPLYSCHSISQGGPKSRLGRQRGGTGPLPLETRSYPQCQREFFCWFNCTKSQVVFCSPVLRRKMYRMMRSLHTWLSHLSLRYCTLILSSHIMTRSS
jgi:hypothetical protein